MLIRRKTGKKIAGITIEVTLSVALSILVLFLALGLFSDNLATMAANSGIQNLFNRNNEIAKTKQDTWGIHPTKTQVNVQVVADQGLSWYLTQAQEKIAYYNQNPPTTQAQVEDLAKQLTIAKIGALTTDSTGATIDFASYYKTYEIKVVINYETGTYETKVGSLKITGDYEYSDNSYKLKTTKSIINNNFS